MQLLHYCNIKHKPRHKQPHFYEYEMQDYRKLAGNCKEGNELALWDITPHSNATIILVCYMVYKLLFFYILFYVKIGWKP